MLDQFSLELSSTLISSGSKSEMPDLIRVETFLNEVSRDSRAAEVESLLIVREATSFLDSLRAETSMGVREYPLSLPAPVAHSQE